MPLGTITAEQLVAARRVLNSKRGTIGINNDDVRVDVRSKIDELASIIDVDTSRLLIQKIDQTLVAQPINMTIFLGALDDFLVHIESTIGNEFDITLTENTENFTNFVLVAFNNQLKDVEFSNPQLFSKIITALEKLILENHINLDARTSELSSMLDVKHYTSTESTLLFGRYEQVSRQLRIAKSEENLRINYQRFILGMKLIKNAVNPNFPNIEWVTTHDSDKVQLDIAMKRSERRCKLEYALARLKNTASSISDLSGSTVKAADDFCAAVDNAIKLHPNRKDEIICTVNLMCETLKNPTPENVKRVEDRVKDLYNRPWGFILVGAMLGLASAVVLGACIVTVATGGVTTPVTISGIFLSTLAVKAVMGAAGVMSLGAMLGGINLCGVAITDRADNRVMKESALKMIEVVAPVEVPSAAMSMRR